MKSFRRATIATGVLTLLGTLSVAPAHATPLPAFCTPSTVVDKVCTARLTSVTADMVNGTITGAPVGGGDAVTLTGQGDAYRESEGFGDARPEPVQQWDEALANVNDLPVDANDPNWYGNAKAKVFLSRTLNGLATEFPPDVLTVRFTPDDTLQGPFRLLFIQPTPPDPASR